MEMIGPMIKQNPFLVVTYLVKLSNYPIFETYLDSLLDLEVSINSIDVVSRVLKVVKAPKEFANEFAESAMAKIMEMSPEDKERQKLARAAVGFIKNFKKTKQVRLEEMRESLERFLDEFMGLEEVQQFRKLMNKE